MPSRKSAESRRLGPSQRLSALRRAAVFGVKRKVLNASVVLLLWMASSLGAIPTSAAAQGAALPPAWAAGGWSPGPETYGVLVEPEVSLRMQDGTVLKAEVLYPTDKATGAKAMGNFPVLLEQTPFRCRNLPGKKFVAHAQYFVSRGYIYVVAQARGTCHSGGAFGWLSQDEAKDGVELVSWAADKVPGSDGRLGLIGCSYPGALQFLTAARLGPGSPVKAMAPTGVAADIYQQVFFPGGTLTRSGDLGYWFIFGWGMGQTNGAESSLRALADIRTGGPLAYDNKYWKDKDPGGAVPAVARLGIPVFNYSSWDDIYPNSPATTAMLQNARAGRDKDDPFGSAGAAGSPLYQVMMAPGAHCSGGDGGPRDQATLAWFDTWIKGKPTGIAQVREPFHLHASNAEVWRSYDRFPFVKDYTRFYLSEGGALRSTPSEAESGHDAVAYSEVAYGAPPEDGESIAYESAPLPDGAMLTGPAVLDAFASSSNSNMLLIADVYSVSPDGTATKLTTGSLIASMRGLNKAKTWTDSKGALVWPAHDFTKAVPLAKEEVVEMPLSVLPRMVKIAPGDRLRLVIRTRTEAAYCTPGVQNPYPCIVGSIPQQLSLEGGRYRIERNRRFASYLALPLEFGPNAR